MALMEYVQDYNYERITITRRVDELKAEKRGARGRFTIDGQQNTRKKRGAAVMPPLNVKH
jgi:hypothetical protein